MDLDMSLLSAVLCADGGYYIAKQEGISSKLLQGEHAIRGWEFIENHVLEFGAVPTSEFFSAKTGIVLIEPQELLPVLIRDVKDRSLWSSLRAAHEQVGGLLEARDSRGAFNVLQDVVFDSYRSKLAGSRVENILSLGPGVLDYYDRMKNGERGIPAPWEAMNEATLGWWDGDFIVFVARMGTGKTNCLLMLARHAWMAGKKVLFVGTEMNRLKLAIRLYSIHLKLPYSEMRSGTLGEFQEQKLREGVAEMMDQEGLYVVGDDFDASIQEIEAAVDELHPDILFVDGLYLVKNEGRDRHTRVSNNADDLKRMAKRRNMPIIASSQFNREVEPDSRSKVSAENIGITDVIGWNADVVYGMYQTSDMKQDEVMGFRPMKLREGQSEDFLANWRFSDMNFEQTDDEVSRDGEDDAGENEGWDNDGALF